MNKILNMRRHVSEVNLSEKREREREMLLWFGYGKR
jgi:hypothetical protein